jgi:hypothetical protein
MVGYGTRGRLEDLDRLSSTSSGFIETVWSLGSRRLWLVSRILQIMHGDDGMRTIRHNSSIFHRFAIRLGHDFNSDHQEI